MFLVDVFDIGVLVTAVWHSVHVGATLTNEGTEPDDCVSSLILFAVDAILVVRISKFFLQELSQCFWLLKLTRFEEVFLLFIDQLLGCLNFFGLLLDWSLNILNNLLLNWNLHIFLWCFLYLNGTLHILKFYFLVVIINEIWDYWYIKAEKYCKKQFTENNVEV